MRDMSQWPAPKLRIGLFVLIFAYMIYALFNGFATGDKGQMATAVFLAPSVALIAPELIEIFPWLWRKGHAHIYEPGENDRIYCYGLINIWMRMEGEIPWFVARDIGNALGVKNLANAVEKMGTTEKHLFEADGELCLSEKGVLRLASSSRSPDAPKFRLWFEREVMFPIRRKQEMESR